jgi:hypothetical protein
LEGTAEYWGRIGPGIQQGTLREPAFLTGVAVILLLGHSVKKEMKRLCILNKEGSNQSPDAYLSAF